MKTLLYAFALSLTLFASLAGQASAQTPPESPNAGTGYIGGSIFISSEYLGSADEDVRPLPYLSFEDIKGFDLFGTSLTYRAIEIGTGQGFDKWSLRAGPSLGYERGRDSEDSPNLTGFEDIDGSVGLGGYARATIGPVGLRFDASKDVAGGHGGLTANASIGTFYRTGRIGIQPSLTVSWGDRDFNDSFFSVTDTQAAASPLAQYDAGSGIYSYSAGLVSWVEFGDKYALSLIGSYRWFTGDAEDSPILNADDGSKNGLFGALSLSRKFDTNQW